MIDSIQNLWYYVFVINKHNFHNALTRELIEEIRDGDKVSVGKLVAILECVWDRNGSKYHEINFIFKCSILGENLFDISPNEEHIKFEWHDVGSIASLHILPESIKSVILEQNVERYTRIITQFW